MSDITVPQWSADDYILGTEPYEFLYGFKDDPLKLMQMQTYIKSQAKAAGINNFITLFSAYMKKLTQVSGASGSSVTEYEGQPIELYTGDYICDEYGVYTHDRFGFEIKVCNHPIMPVRRLVNVDTGQVKMEITFKRGKAWRTLIANKTTLSNSKAITELSEFGVSVDSESAKHLVKYFTEIEDLNYNTIPEVKSVGRLGWITDHGFSPYVDSLIYDGDICYKPMFDAVQQKGRYEVWKDYVKGIRVGPKVPARIVLAASFASALVEPCNALPFFVHLWGGTEAGKTVGLMLSASVWANPRLGDYIKTFNSTAVGLELTAGFVNSLPLVVDELQVIKDRMEFDRLIYMLSEGAGKSRGAKGGGIQKPVVWKNCILTTGEMPISNSNSGAGAINRIIEIDCKDDKLFDNAPEVVAVVLKNHGFAGRDFVSHLQNDSDREYAISIQKRHYNSLIDGESTEKQALAGSLILAADELINEWIFQDDRTLTVEDISQYLATKADTDSNMRAYDWLMDFIASNPLRFKPSDNGEYVGEAWGAIDEEYCYFIKSVFEEKTKDNGYNPRAFLSWANRAGKIECDGKNKLYSKVKRLKNGGIARCVWIKLDESMSDESELNDELPF